MPKTGAVKHTHQYYRRDNGLWHCSGIEGCTHYRPKNMPEPTGQKSLCWRCEKPFLLAPYNMENDKPVCDTCEENLSNVEDWLKSKGMLEDAKPKVGLEAFGAKPKPKPVFNPSIVVKVEKDEIEVIEADDTHAPDCDVYMGGECSCK